jgi:SAM-dependent methyltransferase
MIERLYYRCQKYLAEKEIRRKKEEREKFIKDGKIPWAPGYWEYRNENIARAINDENVLEIFRNGKTPEGFGVGLDERITEYSWIFSRMPSGNINLLDAGSTFNYDFILAHQSLADKSLSILTYAPERKNYNEKRISYLYADLRDMPLRDEYFDMVISQSTVEHIDMDNSIYGYDLKHNEEAEKKSYEYLKAVSELLRVLKKGGTLLLTFPYGKFENHGFFQQFDKEMTDRILELLDKEGVSETFFFRYYPQGWKNATQEDCAEVVSFNPHTGRGKGEDGAAHCRCVCCIHFKKRSS